RGPGVACALALTASSIAGCGGTASPHARTGVEHGPARAAIAPAARLAVSRGLGAVERPYWVRAAPPGLVADSERQHLRAHFGADGVRVGALALAVRGFGRDGAMTPFARIRPRASRNRVTYGRPGLIEWYASGPLGIEQGFDVARRPGGGGGAL